MLALFALVASASAAAPLHRANGERIDGEYVVVFHPTTTPDQRETHIRSIESLISQQIEGPDILNTFSMTTLHGYSARLNQELLKTILADDSVVEFVEESQVYRTTKPVQKENVVLFPNLTNAHASGDRACTIQTEATWGIVRTSMRQDNINGEYPYDPANLGEGVSAYIIDTGIYLDHSEFEGRAIFGFSSISGEPEDDDLNGHGTHVAGTVGSKNFGIAKKATLVAVKVLSQYGSGSTAGVIEGIQFVMGDHIRKRNKCVSNLSLGGGKSLSMNRAVEDLADSGCAVAVASGNEGRDACLSSPASADKVYAVNAMEQNDHSSYFTNYGACTDIYAPGTAITSTWIGSEYAINTISGTSMASPHVCGVMAKIAQAETSDPVSVYDEITRDATKDAIQRVPSSATPNLLLYSPCSV